MLRYVARIPLWFCECTLAINALMTAHEARIKFSGHKGVAFDVSDQLSRKLA